MPADGGTVFVRLLNEALGTYDGYITHESGGATQKNVAVEGEVSTSICYDVSLAATEDNYLSAANVQYNNGGSGDVRIDANTGTSGRTGLLKWNLSSIPPSATIQSASLKLNVTEASTIGFDLYQMRRDWVEGDGNRTNSTTSSNWSTYDGVNSWETPGAVGTELDRYDDNLWGAGAGSFTSTGSKTLALNSIGVGVIQGWVSETFTNYGLTMQNNVSTTADALQFDSSEATTADNRPTLLINYCMGEINNAPNQPVLVQPADGATDVSLPPTLEVTVTDADEDAMDVSFYGREVSTEAPAEDFLFIAIPDTQSNAQYNNTVLQAQFDWIENRYVSPPAGQPDLVFVTHLGDLVNTATDATQWSNIDAAFDQLDPVGAPYSVGPGNHDLGTLYSTNFGNSRFTGKTWYQGYYTSGNDNYNNFSFFSAGGMDFIVINLQYQVTSGALDWADALLKANTTKRGIVVQHDILNLDNSWNNQAAYTALSDNPNLFLMLCGHMHSASDGSAYLVSKPDPVCSQCMYAD